MNRTGNLIEQIYDTDNLYLAYYKASRGKHVKQAVIDFGRNLDINIRLLRQQLQTGEVQVGNYHYFTIYDPKQRTICAAAFQERVLHHALMNVCHPYFDRHLIAGSYATRIGKGVYAAIDNAFSAMSRYQYVCKLDVRKYFGSISHIVLKQQLRRLFKDADLLKLFDKIIDSYDTQAGYGIPIGNLTSQYFANHYLSSVDHYAKEQLKIPVYIRYMDDILFFGNDKEMIKTWVVELTVRASSALELNFKPYSICKCRQGISFLGYQLFPNKILLNSRSKKRFHKKMMQYAQWMNSGRWSEADYCSHVLPLLAFARHAYTKRLFY
ncbi:MAG: RNA-directed DNA polymerase [Bacteroidetes bacterium]|nr:RNA-directed DNA polymerase [Bacteroidota bacterium]